MTDKEAIQTFEYFLDDISKNGGCTIDINFQHKKEYEVMWKILHLIQTQNKVIDLMSWAMTHTEVPQAEYCICRSMSCEVVGGSRECKNCIKEYFINKVEKENK